jgi:hypothetical protein
MAFRRIGVLLAASCALLLVTALPAAAHNELKSSNPAAGATVDTPPDKIVLTFAEDLIPGKTTITVTGPDGANVAAAEAALSGPTATIPITAAHAGAYTVAYKVTADDGDVTNSKLTFTLALTAATTTTTTTTSAPTTAPQAQNTANSDSGTTWWPWLVGALALILIAVLLLVFLRRRRANRANH